MQSCIYRGWVRHRRLRPIHHEFRSDLFMMYLDLAEIDRLFDRNWFWSTGRFAPAWFRRRDHFGDETQSLDQSVRDLVERKSGERPQGPIRILTQLRYFGFLMNPVSFYLCFGKDESIQYIVAEVNNTPWNERHCYVLGRDEFANMKEGVAKEFHVSPFMPMDVQYRWKVTEPAENLLVHIASEQKQEKLFDVTMRLNRVEINRNTLAGILVRFPFMTAQIYARIYWQAYRLWRKSTPVYSHPSKTKPSLNNADTLSTTTTTHSEKDQVQV